MWTLGGGDVSGSFTDLTNASITLVGGASHRGGHGGRRAGNRWELSMSSAHFAVNLK